MSGTSDDSSAWGSDDGSEPEESLDGSLDSDDDDEAFTHTTVAALEQRSYFRAASLQFVSIMCGALHEMVCIGLSRVRCSSAVWFRRLLSGCRRVGQWN